MKNFALKLKEAAVAVLPITALVLILNFALGSMPALNLASFAVGAVLLIFGMALYTLGSSIFMEPAGEHIGAKVTSTRKVWFILIVAFVVGVVVTVAEPDLTVLAHQVPSIPDLTLILTVAAGIGLFLVVALLRIRWQIDLKYLLIGFYALIFLLVCFSMDSFVAVAFDSSGVTTGPITSWECKKENASGALPITHSLFLFLPRCPSLRTRLDQSRKEPLLQGIVQHLLQVPWQ